MKNCNKCKLPKEYSEYYKKKASSDGYSNICISCRKEYNEQSKDLIKQYNKENKEKNKEVNKQYYQDNREQHLKRTTEYGKNNPEVRRKATKKYLKNNPKYYKTYRYNRYHSDPSFKLRLIMGNRLHAVLKEKNVKKRYKNNTILKLLGCTLEECKKHIENQFKPDMTWENHGPLWEVDHIIPCDAFDLSIYENQEKCFHYTNLQPLYKPENRIKSNKI